MKLKLKKRKETIAIALFYGIHYGGIKALLKKYRKEGYFCPPWHYFVDEDGRVYTGREEDEVAGSEYPNNDSIIAIVVNSPDDISITPDQAEALDKLFLKLPAWERIDINVNTD